MSVTNIGVHIIIDLCDRFKIQSFGAALTPSLLTTSGPSASYFTDAEPWLTSSFAASSAKGGAGSRRSSGSATGALLEFCCDASLLASKGNPGGDREL